MNQAIGIGEEIGDRWLVTKSLNTLGGVYAEQGRLAAGREHFERCRNQAKAHGFMNLEVSALINLGNVWDSLGELDRAISYIKEAMELVPHLHSRRREAGVHGTLAMLYSSAERVEDACRHYGMAIERTREVRDQSYQAVLEGNWGMLLLRHGDPEAAEPKLERAIQICDDIWPPGAGSFRGSLARVRALQGRKDEAMALLQRGEEQLVDSNKPALGLHYIHWAETMYILDDAEGVTQAVRRAREIEIQLGKEGASDLTRSLAAFEARIESDTE